MKFKKGDKFETIYTTNFEKVKLIYEIQDITNNNCYIYNYQEIDLINKFSKIKKGVSNNCCKFFDDFINKDCENFKWLNEQSKILDLNSPTKYDQDIRNFFKSGSHNQAKVWAIKRER